MRKAFAISILCCLLFLTGGYHLFYYLRIREAKLEMKRSLLTAKEDQLVCFVFTAPELEALHWEDDHEFYYGHDLYDVLKKEVSGGKTTLYCLSDKNEKGLVDAYLKTQKQSSGNSSAAIAKLMATVFLPVLPTALLPLDTVSTKKKTRFCFSIPRRSSPILTPPPQVA